MQMTQAIVLYRLKGLMKGGDGRVFCRNRVIAKVSRPEVAEAFMRPAPTHIVQQLLSEESITEEQAEWSKHLPMSHDICVEADSGGHTDGGIPSVLFPAMLQLNRTMTKKYAYQEPICMGLAGGIGTPDAAAAAFVMGADFILTGSINQCTVEASTSDDVKALLQDSNVQDTEYAPAGDMFEMGAKVQVLKKGVFFPSRANKLFSLYSHHNSLDEIPEKTQKQLQTNYFKKTFSEIWSETKRYLEQQGHLHEIAKAEANAKHKMALVFRWYFAYTTRLALEGKSDDRVNYQIHTGPALGAFNQWVKGTELEFWKNRHVDEIGKRLLVETAEYLNNSLARLIGGEAA
jgi:trans-AT polyketide synthase, acyltransferase and oxidoreductase domains